MNVLSLFDGIACGRHALERCGIPVTSYYASEVDKYAIQIARKNYPDIIHVGDVRRINIIGRIPFDLLIGGSPCQGFSVAGKGLNFDDPRSKLFFEYVRILNDLRKVNPNIKFLLENVRMKKEWQDRISELLGVEPIKINSSLVCAQNRVRLYWCNWKVEQPLDRGIVLKDILEDEVDEKYYLSSVALARIERGTYSHPSLNPDKTGTLNTKNNSGQLSIDSGTTLIARVIQLNPSKESNGCQPFQQNRVYDPIGKSPNLSAEMSSGTHAIEITSAYPRTGSKTSQGGTGQLSRKDGKSYCVDTGNSMYVNRIRRLTPIECERLQGLGDDHTKYGMAYDNNGLLYQTNISDSQRYKAIGNGWQIDTIMHIFEGMKKAPPIG